MNEAEKPPDQRGPRTKRKLWDVDRHTALGVFSVRRFQPDTVASVLGAVCDPRPSK